MDRSIKIDEPSWLALRVSTQAKNEFGRQLFAHTSPIYIKVEGKSIRQPEEAAYLVKQMEEAKQEIATKALFASPKEREGSCLFMKRASEALGIKRPSTTTPRSDDTLRLSTDPPAFGSLLANAGA